MKNRLIHENLDTSFVNLPALIRYLQRRQFAGSVRIELSGYEAEVILTAENQLIVREHDRIAGRAAEGEEALQRLLIRAREPGGIINVFQSGNESPAAVKKSVAVQTVVSVVPPPPHKNGNSKNAKPEMPAAAENDSNPPNKALQNLPFELSNKVEDKARQTNLSDAEWQMLLNVIAELLSTIDRTLAEAGLDFTTAFENARAEISGDYPFMHPSLKKFDYRSGKITLREHLNEKIFAASINESVRRILDKLGKHPKFSNVHRAASREIFGLMEKRKPLYDKFSITTQLEKTIGFR